MSLNPDGRENKIKLISDTMTGFYSVMRNLQEDYATYHQNYSEEALALLSRSDDFIESVEAVRSLDSLSRIDDEGINELFLLSQQISELYHLNVQTKIEDEKPKTLPKKIKSEKSFWNTLWGALQGEYNENPTGMEILIDMGINFIPFVGQACDVRDITACLKKLVIERRVNEVMIWVTLLLTAIGCVPVAGDVIKAGCKAIIKGADDAVLTVLRKLDADDVQRAFKMLKTKFTSSIDDAIAMVSKWIEKSGNSKYGSKVNEVLAGANENLRKASDFVNDKIDEFEKRIFRKEKATVELINEIQKSAKFKNATKYLDDIIIDNGKANPSKLKEIRLALEKGEFSYEEVSEIYNTMCKLNISEAYEKELIEHMDFGKYLSKMVGEPPANMCNPHAHHILFKVGNGKKQQALVQEGQEILRKYGIDPIVGKEVLCWAPNAIKGQHDINALKMVVDELKAADEIGCDVDDILIILKENGKIASKRF
jgi:hypothetical protein